MVDNLHTEDCDPDCGCDEKCAAPLPPNSAETLYDLDEVLEEFGIDLLADLADFLLARIAEDEQRAVGLPSFWVTGGRVIFDPARVLAECEAKRRIVEPWRAGLTEPDPFSVSLGSEENWRYGIHSQAREAILRLLALPYANHPDYRQEWRP
jgi:hypothetical protein